MLCGYGEECPISALPRIFGDDTKVTPEKFSSVENQSDVWEEAEALGREIARRLGDRLRM
jgi:hypothetical protein